MCYDLAGDRIYLTWPRRRARVWCLEFCVAGNPCQDDSIYVHMLILRLHGHCAGVGTQRQATLLAS